MRDLARRMKSYIEIIKCPYKAPEQVAVAIRNLELLVGHVQALEDAVDDFMGEFFDPEEKK